MKPCSRFSTRVFASYDLGRPLTVGMPQSPNHPAYWHALPRRHGDMVRADGGSAANDIITMGTHVGTHIDALAHVSQDGSFRRAGRDGGTGGWALLRLGAHTIEPMVRRGVLLDVPATRGVDRLEGGEEISVAELEATVTRQDVEIRSGDVVLVRSGWGQHFDTGDGDTFRGLSYRRPRCGRGRGDLAGRAGRPRDRRRHHRLRMSEARRRTRAAPCAPRAARRARHLHHRDDGPRGVWRRRECTSSCSCCRPCSSFGGDRVAGPPARGGGHVTDLTLGEQVASFAERSAKDGVPGRRRAPASSSGCSTCSGSGRRRTPTDDQRAPRSGTCSTRAATRRRPRSASARVTAAQAAFVNGVLAHSLDYDDTHLPSVLHPSACVVPAALAAGEHAGATGARPSSARSRSGSRSPCVSGWPATTRRSATRCSSSTASTRPRSPARWARGRCLPGLRPGPTRCDALGLTASMASGIIEANRTGGTVKRLHCGFAAQAGGDGRSAGPTRVHRTADSARGSVRVLRGLAARAVRRRRPSPTGSARSGRCPASSSSPTRPTTSRTRSIDAGLAFRGSRHPARGRRVGHGRRRRPRSSARSASRSRPSATPETGYQAQFSGPYAVTAGLIGGGGLGVGLDDFTDELAQDPARRAVMARSTWCWTHAATRSTRTSSRPSSR